MTDEDWINRALTDDTLVIDILLKLHHHHHADPTPPVTVSKTVLDWTVRQRRSKSVLKNDVNRKDEGEGTRASPTTPLSWSGATSVSGGGGGVEGFEESSRLAKPFDGSRSKVAVTSETTNTNKRSRKKKTLAELREEENLLVKERRNLKTELATMRFTVEKHIATNESLKRMKLDMQSIQTFKTTMHYVASQETISNQPVQTGAASACTPTDLPIAFPCSNVPTAPKVEDGNREAHCLLPDLNLPIEEEPGSEILYGTS